VAAGRICLPAKRADNVGRILGMRLAGQVSAENLGNKIKGVERELCSPCTVTAHLRVGEAVDGRNS
jgi:hypothetical protein